MTDAPDTPDTEPAEFDRAAAILAELDRMDDDTTAFVAGITFVDGDDHGTCQALREAVAEEYRTGRAERRDKFRTARTVGNNVAEHGSHMTLLAAISRIGDMRTTIVEDSDDDAVLINDGDDVDVVVLAVLRVRYRQAAEALLTHLEEYADDRECDGDDDGKDVYPMPYQRVTGTSEGMFRVRVVNEHGVAWLGWHPSGVTFSYVIDRRVDGAWQEGDPRGSYPSPQEAMEHGKRAVPGYTGEDDKLV